MQKLKLYPIKSQPIKGGRLEIITKRARGIYRQVEKRTKRKAYVRSAYFHKEKIFFDFFFSHLNQKNRKTKTLRLKLLPCALELIELSFLPPQQKDNPNISGEVLYRFGGILRDKKVIVVQIKEDKKTKQKFLMSVFFTK